MRSKEQFKAYVYAKAETACVRNKKLRAIALRGAAAFSLFIVIGGVMLHNNITNDAAMSAKTISAEAKESVWMYGSTDKTTDVEALLDSAEFVAENYTAAASGTDDGSALYSSYETQSYVEYSATTTNDLQYEYFVAESTDTYKGELEKIDFKKNVALVLKNCGSISNFRIEYSDNSISVAVTAEKSENNPLSTYTVLLDKSKYTGQPIEIIFE